MSKYLKWYDSYLDHTPTEELAKNELESAHRKIKHATEQLAKANERIKELKEQQTEDLMFLLEQSLIIEHKQDYKKLKELREKYGIAF